mgnify:CR=1 FL=1
MYDGIIFDMDGTIWDSRETIVKAWNDELKAQGIDRVITVSELTGYMGLTMDAIAEGIFPDKKYSETKHIFDKMYERENEYLRKKGAILYPDVISTLKELKKKGHPAKQIFQAIRIEVNDELGAADESIQQAIDLLAVDGRISVITFHSLEDRLTKQLFKEASTVEVPKGLPFIPDDMQPKLALVNRKPILPRQEELEANNRSHSAKLRVARKVRK